MPPRPASLVCVAAFTLASAGGCVEQKRIDHGYRPETGGFVPPTAAPSGRSSSMEYRPLGSQYRGTYTGGYDTLGKPRPAAVASAGPRPMTPGSAGQTEVFPRGMKPRYGGSVAAE